MQNGSIYSFQAGSSLASLNFPHSLLESGEAAAEAAFRACMAGQSSMAMLLQVLPVSPDAT